MFTLLMPSRTMVVSSDVAVTLLEKARISRMRDRSVLADVPRLIRLNTSFRQFCLPLNRSFTLTSTLEESEATASTFRLAMSGSI